MLFYKLFTLIIIKKNNSCKFELKFFNEKYQQFSLNVRFSRLHYFSLLNEEYQHENKLRVTIPIIFCLKTRTTQIVLPLLNETNKKMSFYFKLRNPKGKFEERERE